VPAATRNELEANSRRVLGEAGVVVEFVECLIGGAENGAATCLAPLGPTDFILRILQPKPGIKAEELGYAAMTPDGGAYITVFINPVQRMAGVNNLSDGALLGHVVAHEMGHLLLGANSHTSGGIMRSV